MLTHLKIRQLFGRFDYDVHLMDGGVSILTGPNGYGKSTILHILSSISSKKIYELFELEFRMIELFFEDGYINRRRFRIEKKGNEFLIDGIHISSKSFRKMLNMENHQMPKYFWNNKSISLFDDNIEEKYFYNEINDSFFIEHFEEEAAKEKNTEEKLFAAINEISKLCGKTRIISDQRLLKKINRNGEDGIEDTISSLPHALKDIIEGVSSEYSVKANSLDSTYPKRLLSSRYGISEMQYRRQLTEAQIKFKKLREYKLAEISLLEGGVYDERFADALKIYFEDFFSKYKVFENLIDQLDLFTSVINNRLRFKYIEISKEKGFVLIDETQGKELELEKLSSGEKQEILLFFDLIFNTDNYEVLLIDEPELSLHISWQQQFMDDLLKVTKMNNLQVIIATHSPQIIGNHWDIQIDLGELYNGY